MTAYVARRLSLLIPTLLFITMAVFLSVRFVPGGVIDQMVTQMGATGETDAIDRVRLQNALGPDAVEVR
ncbi:MAG: hypothetical protein HY667_02750 [Chloroflexi bacterium]|nr:hypothetical protein [Chloroflexota bacterium]